MTVEAAFVGGGSGGKEIVTMASEMPDFISIEPMPNRAKEITIIYTLTFEGYYQVRVRGTETIRIALNRLSKMPNWLPGYNLRFELIDVCFHLSPPCSCIYSQSNGRHFKTTFEKES